jgi:hypothetical protein
VQLQLMTAYVRCCFLVSVGLNSVPKMTVFCVANLYYIVNSYRCFGMNSSFLKNVNELLQKYMELCFASDFYSEHDKHINGGKF